MTDGDMPGARPLSVQRHTAAQTRRWRLLAGPGPQPAARRAPGPGDPVLCQGLTSSSRPFPAAPHQPFNFQLDLLLSHGNGMQIGPGGLTGASGCDLSLGPQVWGDHFHLSGADGGPRGEGLPLVPLQWSSSPTIPTAPCWKQLMGVALAMLSSLTDPDSPWLLTPPVPSHGPGTPPTQAVCPPQEPPSQPALCWLQLGTGSQTWLGREGAPGHQSPGKSHGQGLLGYHMLPSASGAFARICWGCGGARGQGGRGSGGLGGSAAAREGRGGTAISHHAGSTCRADLGEEREAAAQQSHTQQPPELPCAADGCLWEGSHQPCCSFVLPN